MQTCETCRFIHVIYRKGDPYEFTQDHMPYAVVQSTRSFDFAQCRIRAPQMARMDYQCDGWPSIAPSDWCGEHQPKDTDHD